MSISRTYRGFLLQALLLLVGVTLAVFAVPEQVENDVFFLYAEDHFELYAQDTTVNRILEEIEKTLFVPVARLARDRPVPFVHTRSRDLDRILASFCDNHALVFVYDEYGRPLLDAIDVGTSADSMRQVQESRRQLVTEQRLRQRFPSATVPKNVTYGGIGAFIQLDESGEAIWLRPMGTNTPAARSGLELGDKVIRIDGRPIQSFAGQEDIAAAIRGEINTPISLIVERPDGSRINQVIMRERIQH